MDWPDDYSKRRFLRDEFLKTVAECEPGVCEALYGEPLILFGKLEEQTIDWEHFEMAADPTSGGALIDSLLKWCATLLLAANEHPKVVSERLGHASITLTLDTYSHVLPSMQQAASEKLERILYG